MNDVKLYKQLERIVARSDPTQEVLRRFTAVLASSARARLARHRKRGKHTITTRKGAVDHFVNLEGEAALSIENGWHADDGSFVRGLDILKGAL
jgi:hypothetical protein